MQAKGSGYPPTASLAPQHASSSQYAANLSPDIPYPPYYTSHQAPPAPQMYSNSAGHPYLNHYIPGLTSSHDGSSAPFATSAGRDHPGTYSQPQHPIPGIGAHSFRPPQRPLAGNTSGALATSSHEAARIAMKVPPSDAEASSDGMDLDTREEGELSSGEVEEGEELTPDSATIPPNGRQHNESHLNNNSWTRHDPYSADMMNSARSTFGNTSGTLAAGGTDSNATRRITADFPKSENIYNHAANGVVNPPAQPAILNEAHQTKGAHVEDSEKEKALLSMARTVAQLRVSAQGALLNLAPHNIRFDELVREGVDPVILRHLYDEIGIKVISESPVKLSTGQEKTLESDAGDSCLQNTEALLGDSAMTSHHITPKASGVGGPQSFGSKPPSGPRAERRDDQSESTEPLGPPEGNKPAGRSSKPLERKDLIARMLAAKAAKPAALDPAAEEFIPADQSGVETPASMAVHSTELPSTDTDGIQRSETRAKEKSRAQTELARQRMEQLKKQGIGKPQIQPAISQPEASAASSVSSQTTSQPSSALEVAQGQHQPLLKHPLPDRPPDPNKLASQKIPGLFMTSSEPAETPAQRQNDVSHQSSTIRLPRKRPRASDFTDDTHVLAPKKQTTSDFQQAHKVIIDLSDDEAMDNSDDDMQVSEDSSSSATPPNQSFSKPLAIRDQPPLRDFPSRTSHPSYSTPVSGNEVKPDNLLQKNKEIQAMRQRIAELERRRAMKKDVDSNRQAGSGDRSYTTPLEKPAAPQVVGDTAAEDERSEQTSFRKPLITPDHSSITEAVPETQAGAIEKLISPSLTPLPSLNPAEPEDIKRRFIRRREIETGLPALDAELIKSEARLARFREEEKKLLAEISKGREGRRLLLEELKGLGVETKDASQEPLDLAADKSKLEEVLPNSPGQDTITDGVLVSDTNPLIDEMPSEHMQASRIAPQLGQTEDIEPEENEISNDVTSAQVGPEENRARASRTPEMGGRESRESSYSSSAMDESMGSIEDLLEDQRTSEEGIYTPTDSIQQLPLPISMDAKDSQPGSVPSSPKPSETKGDSDSHREASVVSEAYEPPEPSILVDQEDNTPPFSPAPPETEVEMDIDSGPSHAPEAPEATEMLTAADQGPVRTAAPVDDRNDGAEEPLSRYKPRFSPYESPLGNFKAYRYHPQFTDKVDGGFRSLTFSHNIDPHNSLCGFELSGGVCNDRSCQLQHFRDMSLSGAFDGTIDFHDKILVEMGSLREGKTPAEQEEYVAGLRQIINDMRRDKVKDFTTVATEIAAYRRRFLQDPSRVLAL